MARPIWTGAITFGLVSVPVTIHAATHEHEVTFHQFEKGTGDRIRYRRVNERTGDEVDHADIVKGADVGGDNYVMLDQDELDSVAPGRSRSLEIHTFVDLAGIDPIYYQRSYYLAPAADESVKTYALLRDAMRDANRAAIGTLVMRGKEYLAAIRPDGDLLVLQSMYFADEVRDPARELDRLPGRTKAKPTELAMAAQLIDSMTGTWNPKDYRDTYTDRVNELIAAKQAGKEVTAAEAAPEPTNVTDLMDVLRRSVENAKQQRGPADRHTEPAAAKKATPGKKATAAKKTTAGKKTTAATKTTAAAKKKTTAAAKKKATAAKKPARRAS